MNTLLGQRIREQRKEKGWTIEQFAERVELSANYVGDLERGVKIPKLETFIRIVEVLDVSADVLIRDSVASAMWQMMNCAKSWASSRRGRRKPPLTS